MNAGQRMESINEKKGKLRRTFSGIVGQKTLVFAIITHFVLNGIQNALAVEQGAAPSTLVATNSPFIVHLSNPPWIKELRYTRSRLQIAGKTPGREDKRAWVNETNLAAVQPSGVFIKELTPSPFGKRRSPDDSQIRGISDEFFWVAATVYGQLILSPRDQGQGASEKNGTQIVVQQMQDELERVRHFGLPAVRPNSFHLHDYNQFEALTIGGQPLEGKVLSATNDRPMELTYHIGVNTADRVSVKYRYGSKDVMLPDYFEYLEQRNGRPFRNDTTWVNRVEYGVDQTIHKGYTPSMFFSNLSIFANNLITWSNGFRYQITPSGKFARVDDRPPVYPTELKGRYRFMVVLLTIFLFPAGFFVCRAVRRDRAKNQQKVKV